ncbi:MAG: hypothetical protein EOP40_19330, partial [Rubrivivax sp.]
RVTVELASKEKLTLEAGDPMLSRLDLAYALNVHMAQGVTATGTRERFEAAGPAMGVPDHEHQAWVGGFEFLQMLRLRAQLDGTTVGDNANRIAVSDLNDIDRRILKETLRVLRGLQQRVRLDYER